MTGQIGELLVVDGLETWMAFCPPLPDQHPRIIEDYHGDLSFSTACWRGYQGSWEVKDGRFFLVGLEGKFKLIDGEPVFADWFSGVLRVPQGEMLLYVHMGFGSVYERELHIKIEEGVVVETRVIHNDIEAQSADEVGWRNLPGSENRFPGDDEF